MQASEGHLCCFRLYECVLVSLTRWTTANTGVVDGLSSSSLSLLLSKLPFSLQLSEPDTLFNVVGAVDWVSIVIIGGSFRSGKTLVMLVVTSPLGVLTEVSKLLLAELLRVFSSFAFLTYQLVE